jgi:hypothetical protein
VTVSCGTFSGVSEKGKPVERRGRKATGPSWSAGFTERQEHEMSDLIDPARRPGRHQGVPAHDEAAHLTLSPTGPMRPETGSALDRLLRRQRLDMGARTLLGYVPAQVR